MSRGLGFDTQPYACACVKGRPEGDRSLIKDHQGPVWDHPESPYLEYGGEAGPQ